MDEKAILESLRGKLSHQLMSRHDKIINVHAKNDTPHEQLANISRHIEIMVSDMRRALTVCHNDLQAFGFCPQELPMSDAPGIDIIVDEKSVRIIMDDILPFPIKGSVYYLHEKLNATLRRYVQENALPQPLFDERCAVVFIHRYTGTFRRHLRDYDNSERRCITNVIARHFLRDDSPACYISMDVLAPGENDHTEIRIMTISDFRAFVVSAQIDFPS